MLEYATKFIELARFAYDYVAWKIRGWSKVVHSKQDFGISPARYGLYGHDSYGHREREIDDAWSIRDASVSDKKKKKN